jgi:hypothetical protein
MKKKTLFASIIHRVVLTSSIALPLAILLSIHLQPICCAVCFLPAILAEDRKIKKGSEEF